MAKSKKTAKPVKLMPLSPKCAKWLRAEIQSAVERVITELETQPVYLEQGEDATLTIRLGFSSDAGRPWNEPPPAEGDGTYVNLQITFARTETR